MNTSKNLFKHPKKKRPKSQKIDSQKTDNIFKSVKNKNTEIGSQKMLRFFDQNFNFFSYQIKDPQHFQKSIVE